MTDKNWLYTRRMLPGQSLRAWASTLIKIREPAQFLSSLLYFAFYLFLACDAIIYLVFTWIGRVSWPMNAKGTYNDADRKPSGRVFRLLYVLLLFTYVNRSLCILTSRRSSAA